LGHKPFQLHGLGLANAGAQPEIGWFWNASQSGRGYAFEVQNNQYFMAMFHYRTDGRPTWNVVQGNMSGSNFASSSFLKYSGGQTINGAYKAPSTPTAEGVISASFSNPCSGSLVLPSGAAVSLQKFSFGGLPAGAECRSMPQVSTVVATTTSNTSTTTGSIGGSSTATTSEVAVTSISGGPFVVGTPALLTLSGTNLNLGRVLRFEVSSGAFSCAETNASQTQCTVIGAGTSDLRVIEKSTGRLLKQFLRSEAIHLDMQASWKCSKTVVSRRMERLVLE
jgi:hypothetical protein